MNSPLRFRQIHGYNTSAMIMDHAKPIKTHNTRTIRITLLDKKGMGWGTTDTGGQLSVPGTIPGEIAEAEKLRRQEGSLLQILEPSPYRISPRCAHFGRCGGCVWQHIDYDHQRRLKQERILQLLEKHGLSYQNELEIEPSSPFAYRNRMDFLWWYDGRFGLRMRGKWYAVETLKECHLLPPHVMNAALEVNRRVQSGNFPFRDSKKRRPGLRYLIIRHGIFTGEIMLAFVSDPMPVPAELWEGIENVTSVYQLINDNPENEQSDGVPVHLWGKPSYQEQMGEHVFHIGPRSFFQPNPAVAVKMVEEVRHIASTLPSRHSLIDLYCGIGLFAISLSDCFEQVIGIENNAEAIAWARQNAQRENTQFTCMDAENWREPSLPEETILTDPPRTGLHPRALQQLLDSSCQDLIYVSCNPTRGIEDLAALSEKYALCSIKGFDQFPQTPHVEMITHLRIR